MLDMQMLVASYHCMQFQETLMKQTWANGKKPGFGPDVGPFDPNSDAKSLFQKSGFGSH